MSPSGSAPARRSRPGFRFPTADSLGRHPGRPQHRRGGRPHAAQHASRDRRASSPAPASTSCSRSRSRSRPRGRSGWWRPATTPGVTLGVVLQHRFKPAAERLAAILRGGRAGRDRQLLDHHPAVAAAELLRRAGPRHQGARRRRRAAHAGHPHARPDAEPRRPRRGGERLRAHHARASHGDGGPRLRGRALCQRRRRRHRCDHRGLSGLGRSASS